MAVAAIARLSLLATAAFFPSGCRALPATINGRRILVNGVPLHMKGVNWNPVPPGAVHPQGVAYRQYVDTDARLMAEAGVNVIRTYEALTDTGVLDILWAHNIQVLNTVYAGGNAPLTVIQGKVSSVMHHPAILMWVAGNEWNYNFCYNSFTLNNCQGHLADVARSIKATDSQHPVATVYGEVPRPEVVSQMSDIDVWGINYYDGISFGDVFQRWAAVSSKPMFIGEYGADAYNSLINRVDENSQSEATRALTRELVDHSAVFNGGTCVGGLIFEFADEWWKDMEGSPSVQEVGGVAPGGGPYPDRVFNEEWWGLVDINRKPRQAYYAFADVAVPQPQLTANVLAAGGNATEGMRKSCTAGGCTFVRRPLVESGCPKQDKSGFQVMGHA